jgi:hypothetical protein
MRYAITCTGPTGTKTVTSQGGGTVLIGLAAGSWHIGVEARYGGALAGLGEGDVEVRAGASNAVTIKMTPTGDLGSTIIAASTGLRIVNAKAAEGGAYGIGEPFQHRLISVLGDGGEADISDWLSPGDLVYDFSSAGTKTVSLAPSSSLSGIPCSSASVEVKTMGDRVAWADTQGGAHTLLAYVNETIPGVIPANANITNAAIIIKSADESPAGMRTLQLTGIGSMFSLRNSGGKLTLGRNITLRGLPTNNNILIYVYASGELTMEEGSAITGNKSGTSGVEVYLGGTFTMNGGTISGNICGRSAVGVISGGTFTMNGSASVSNNTVTGTTHTYGGGVYVSDGTFTMNNSASVTGNTINSSYADGGGVCVREGTFTMNNSASISGNTATGTVGPAYGGGVYMTGGSGSFTIGGSASVSNNTVTGTTNAYGGGVYVGLNNTFTMDGASASISGNRVTGPGTNRGGGVYTDGTFTLTQGTVYGTDVSPTLQNTAAGNGDALYKAGGTAVGGSTLTPLVTTNTTITY